MHSALNLEEFSEFSEFCIFLETEHRNLRRLKNRLFTGKFSLSTSLCYHQNGQIILGILEFRRVSKKWIALSDLSVYGLKGTGNLSPVLNQDSWFTERFSRRIAVWRSGLFFIGKVQCEILSWTHVERCTIDQLLVSWHYQLGQNAQPREHLVALPCKWSC